MLVLSLQSKKLPDDPSSYCPLCMLDTAGKISPLIVHNRIKAVIGNLTDNQYNLRKSRSILDTINHMISTARKITPSARWKRKTKKYCLIAALDNKNAFNSVILNNVSEVIKLLQRSESLKK